MILYINIYIFQKHCSCVRVGNSTGILHHNRESFIAFKNTAWRNTSSYHFGMTMLITIKWMYIGPKLSYYNFVKYSDFFPLPRTLYLTTFGSLNNFVCGKKGFSLGDIR